MAVPLISTQKLLKSSEVWMTVVVVVMKLVLAEIVQSSSLSYAGK